MRWIVACALAVMIGWPGAAAAQSCLFGPPVPPPEQRGTVCADDGHCEQGEVCSENECVPPHVAEERASKRLRAAPEPEPQETLPRSPRQAQDARARTAAATLTADAQCDEDRRCRIERLKQREAAKRRSKGLAHDRRVMELQQRWEEEQQAAINRIAAPINIDFLVQYIAPYGLTAGYTFDGKLRLSAQVGYIDTYASYSNFVEAEQAIIDGSLAMWVFGAEASYLFSDSALSPYVTAGFYMADGTLGSYDYDSIGTGGERSDDLALHMVGAALGVDLQFAMGLRFKAGGTLRYPIYAGATTGGVNNEVLREGLRAWFKEDGMVGFEVALGWAF